METSNAFAQSALIGWIANAELALKVPIDAELKSGEVIQTTATKNDRKIKTHDL
jgi:hypothetical protein